MGDASEPNVAAMKTFVATYSFVFDRLGDLARVAWLPAVVTIITSLVMDLVFGYRTMGANAENPLEYGSSYSGDDLVRLLVNTPVQVVAISVVMARWHRITLGLERASTIISLDRRDLGYIGYFLLVSLIVYPVSAIPVVAALVLAALTGMPALSWIGIAAGVTVLIYLSARLMLVFPAVATGQKTGLRHSWNRTRDHGWRLAWLYVLIDLPIVGSLVLITLAMMAAVILFGEPLTAMRTATVALLLVWFLLVGLLASAMSLAWRALEPEMAAAGQAAPV